MSTSTEFDIFRGRAGKMERFFQLAVPRRRPRASAGSPPAESLRLRGPSRPGERGPPLAGPAGLVVLVVGGRRRPPRAAPRADLTNYDPILRDTYLLRAQLHQIAPRTHLYYPHISISIIDHPKKIVKSVHFSENILWRQFCTTKVNRQHYVALGECIHYEAPTTNP